MDGSFDTSFHFIQVSIVKGSGALSYATPAVRMGCKILEPGAGSWGASSRLVSCLGPRWTQSFFTQVIEAWCRNIYLYLYFLCDYTNYPYGQRGEGQEDLLRTDLLSVYTERFCSSTSWLLSQAETS